VVFLEVFIPMVTVLFKIIHLKKNVIMWKIKEHKGYTPIIITILKVGEALKIKVLSKAHFNNNNHYILHPKKEKGN